MNSCGAGMSSVDMPPVCFLNGQKITLTQNIPIRNKLRGREYLQ